MRRLLLLAVLLVGLTGHATIAQSDLRRHPGRHGHPHAQILAGPQLGFVQPDWPYAGLLPGHDHPGPWWWQTTPWHYHPQGPCPPPWCLPSYHRHRGVLADPRAVPLEAVLERLKHQDYHSFGNVFLVGANYNIVARNRYGRAVRLIVNAGNGQIRRIIQ
jgi:hypothetical protein